MKFFNSFFCLLCSLFLGSCSLLVHKKCDEQGNVSDLASLEQLMDSTDFQILKIGLCEIKFEGGDLNNYTYHEIKNFSTNKDLNRKHVIQISTKSMDASFDLAETIGCENWKQNRMQLIISKSRKICGKQSMAETICYPKGLIEG